MEETASHRPPQMPRVQWPQAVLTRHRGPLHPAEGEVLPVGATQKPLEHMASGGLEAGAGLAQWRCPWTTGR